MSGRELFLLDSSLFVDDDETYDKYQREESDATEKKVDKDTATDGPSTLSAPPDTEVLSDNDELDIDDELNELEASLSKTSIQINEKCDNV